MFQHHRSSPQNPKRVVILGSGGFIGHRLAARLKAEGIEVFGARSTDIDLCSADSTEALKALLRTEDAVAFASAITPDRGKDATAFMKNIQMAQHVGRALAATPCSHVIYMSSDAMFAENLPPIDENTPAAPPNLYGTMHLAREQILSEALKPGKTAFLILRPCSVYGAGDTHNGYGPNRFIRAALQDRRIKVFGKGEEKRPHLYIDDLVEILFQALRRQTGGFLHAVPHESVSFGELAQTIARLASNGTEIESLPRSGPVTHKHFNPSNLLRAFPETPLTPLEPSLRAAIAGMKT